MRHAVYKKAQGALLQGQGIDRGPIRVKAAQVVGDGETAQVCAAAVYQGEHIAQVLPGGVALCRRGLGGGEGLLDLAGNGVGMDAAPLIAERSVVCEHCHGETSLGQHRAIRLLRLPGKPFPDLVTFSCKAQGIPAKTRRHRNSVFSGSALAACGGVARHSGAAAGPQPHPSYAQGRNMSSRA